METDRGREHPVPEHEHEPGPLPRPRPSRRRRRWRLVGLVGGAVLVLGAVAYYWFFMRPYESTEDAFIDANVVPIAPQVAGQVLRLYVHDNQFVAQDAPILQIDPRDYQARVTQANASLAAAGTRLEEANAQMASDLAKVQQEQASLESAQSEAQRAQADLQRYQSVQSQAVSRSQIDLAAAQARAATAAVQVARSRVQAAEAQVKLSQAAIQTSRAMIKSNEALVRQAELALSYTRITAPVEGYVTHRTVEPGAYLQPGQALLALVPTQVWVTANYKETQLTHMRVGQPVTLDVDAYPHHPFQGHVQSIQRGSGARFSLLPPENATGNYIKVVQRVPVKILFDEPPNPKLPLGPGMSVTATVNILAQPRPQTPPQPPNSPAPQAQPNEVTRH